MSGLKLQNAWWIPPSIIKFVFAFGPRDSFGAKSICVFCLETKATNAESPFSPETMKTYKKNKILSVMNSINLREDL